VRFLRCLSVKQTQSRDLGTKADELEGEAVRMALEVGGWLEGRACKVLGLSKTTASDGRRALGIT
jgi:hypothetical protein